MVASVYFIDFRKAFDLVDYSNLLYKLGFYQFWQTTCKFFNHIYQIEDKY